MIYAAYGAAAAIAIGISMYVIDLVRAPVAIQDAEKRRRDRYGDRVSRVKEQHSEELRAQMLQTRETVQILEKSAETDAKRAIAAAVFRRLLDEASSIAEETRSDMSASCVVDVAVDALRVRIVGLQRAAILTLEIAAPGKANRITTVPGSIPGIRDTKGIIQHAALIHSALQSDHAAFQASSD